MNSLILILAISCAVVLVAAEDKCKNDFQSFLRCVKDKYEAKPQSEKDAAKKEKEDRANKCFADAGCDAPDWNKDPTGGAMKGHGGMDMPDSVKNCLKKKLIEKVGAKLNECLSKRGVQNVNFSEIAESAEGAGISMEGHGSAGKDGLQASMSAKFNAVKAVDKCSQKKGGDTDNVKDLEQCLQTIKHDQKPKVCAFIKPCEDKVTGDCKKRGQEIRTALCQCKKEKELEVAKKLKELGKANAKVGIQELIKTVAGDQDMQDIINQVDQCYKDNNVDEPPLLKLAIQMMSKGGSGGGGAGARMSAKLSVNGSTCVIMADMMTLDANDKSECEPCPN
jgi:hypothetical protein